MRVNGFSARRSCVTSLSAILLLGTLAPPISWAQTQAAANDLTGQWQGTAQAPPPAPEQRVVFQVSKADGGGWKTVFNYIDLIAQGNGIPRSANLTLQGSAVEIKVPGNSGSYHGQLSADGKTITGSWTQGGPDMRR